MVQLYELNDPRLPLLLQEGGVSVIRTDTLYGVLALATNETAVERVYTIKSRQRSKQLIVLIDSLDDLFDAYPTDVTQVLGQLWPGKNTIVLPSAHAPEWLLRGGDSVAYRMPDDDNLRALIRKSGPLVAPSANPESQPPALTINQAIDYFGDGIDAYVDGGTVIDQSPSKIYRLHDGQLEQLR